MPRHDLLAIGEQDLELYSNRGNLKRALKELAGGEMTFEIQEHDDGTVVIAWSDGVTCTLPGSGTVADGRCTCPATTGICRHLVRSVLAYQQARQPATAAPVTDWDPGQLTDAMLEAAYPKAALTAARTLFEQGVLVELARGQKPFAHFHGLGHAVRFMVPGDLRYVHSDATGPEAMQAAIMAAWAFRLLPPESPGGYVVSARPRLEINRDLAAACEQELVNIFGHGFSGAPPHFADTLRRRIEQCRAEEWIWPAEDLAALTDEYLRYHEHDALCNPGQAVSWLAEWVIRLDVLRNEHCPVPALLVRGMASDRQRQLGAARLIGLGCAVRRQKKSATLQIFMQNADTAAVVLMERQFALTAAQDYWRLAETVWTKGVPLRLLAASQILMSGAKQTAAGQLIPSRRTAINPQNYAWEMLREPLRADNFSELQNRLGCLPPSSLRPVRVAGDFQVLKVARVTNAGFDAAQQAVKAELLDAEGNAIRLAYPHVSEAREGTEALLHALTEKGADIRFVAGLIRPASHGLEILPVSLVIEENGARRLIQPAVDRFPAATTSLTGFADSAGGDPLRQWLALAHEAVAELLLVGLRHHHPGLARHWQELARQASGLGLVRLAEQTARVASELERQSHDLRWDWQPAARHLVTLAVSLRLAQEQS